MSVEYIYAYILISIATSGADHQIKLAINSLRTSTQMAFKRLLVFVSNYIANRECCD